MTKLGKEKKIWSIQGTYQVETEDRSVTLTEAMTCNKNSNDL